MKITSLLIAASMTLTLWFSTASAQTKLIWWHHLPPEGAQGQLFQKYADEFVASNPGTEIEIVTVPHAQFFIKLPAAIAAGEPPDVFGLSYRRLSEFVGLDTLSPIDGAALASMDLASLDDLQAAWAPGVLDAYRVGDNFYGLPFQFNIYAYIINKKHFIDAGLDPQKDFPRTWDQLYSVEQKLVQTSNGRTLRQAQSFPFVNSAAWYLLELEPIMRELGGSILTEDQTEALINSPVGVQAMALIKKRFDLGYTDKDIAVGLDYHNTGFPTGEFSITIGGNWGIPRWEAEFDGVSRDDFLAIPYPTFDEGSPPAISTTSWAWTVYEQSDTKDLAWKFANFITSQPSRNIIETGDIVPRAGWSDSEGAKTIPQADFWEEMLQFSQPLAQFRNYGEVSDAIKIAMEEILLTDKDIQETLDRAKADIDVILARD